MGRTYCHDALESSRMRTMIPSASKSRRQPLALKPQGDAPEALEPIEGPEVEDEEGSQLKRDQLGKYSTKVRELCYYHDCQNGPYEINSRGCVSHGVSRVARVTFELMTA